jgi:hypothetical protein
LRQRVETVLSRRRGIEHEARRIGAREHVTERIFPTLPTAVQAYVQWYTARHGAPPVEDALGMHAGQRGDQREEAGP